jgi:L-fuculose-phosphate aldolase
LDARSFVANHDGNVSVRLETHRYLATPTARGKAELQESDLLVISEDGATVEGEGRVFSEWAIHRAVYQASPEARAVVHAHPPFVTALGVQRQPLVVDFLPEALVSLGSELPLVTRELAAKPAELAVNLKKVADHCVGFLVEGNGIFAFASDVVTAYYRVELAEHLASITAKIPREDKFRLPKDVRKVFLERHHEVFRKIRSAPLDAAPASPDINVDEIITRVMDALR